MIVLRSLAFNVVFYAVLIGMMIVGLPVLFAGPARIKAYARSWARFSLWLLAVVCDVQTEIRGAKHLTAGGAIVAAKHQSFLDIIALLSIAPRFVFVLKRELMVIPLFGWFLKKSGMIPIDRSRGRAVMADLNRRVREALAREEQLIIFPEGTRRAPGAEPAYKSGVSHLYAASEAPCCPVALNSGLFWPRRSFLRKPGRCVVEVLSAIPPGLERATFLAELEQRIETATNQLMRQAEEPGHAATSAVVRQP